MELGDLLVILSLNDLHRPISHGIDLLPDLNGFLRDLLIHVVDLLDIDIVLKPEQLLHVVPL